MVSTKDIKNVLDIVETQADKDVISNLRARLSACEGIVREMSKTKGGQLELARTVSEAVKAVVPYPNTYKPVKVGSSSEIAAVVHLSDLHIGEIVRPAETEGFGAFNFAIAEKRMETLSNKVLEWVEMHRKTFNIPKLYVVGNGDYVSGDIHKELLVTNEFPLPEQTAKAGILIGQFLRRLAPHFKSVDFYGSGADNHGRLQPKPQSKQKANNSMSFLVHAIMKAYLADHPSINFDFAEGAKLTKEIANHKFLIQHGDGIKAVLGIPWYGIERMRGREASRRMKTPEKTFDYMMIAHFHTPGWVSGNILMNGSLSGTTEYDHEAGRHAAPSQTSFLVHPKYGVFDFTPWKFNVEEEETDGRRKK